MGGNRNMIDWHILILDAQRAGFAVFEEDGMWFITVPSRPRMPSHVLGSYRDAQAAWRGAALIKTRFWPKSRGQAPTRGQGSDTVDNANA
jgi:hypothetical protein